MGIGRQIDQGETNGMETQRKTRVAIAGASGFVGRALRRALCRDFDVLALTRRPSAPDRTARDADGVEWRSCDLFDEETVVDAFAGVDVVIYLVHSMSPQSRLTQARFEDLDLVLAHNARRAADRAGVERVIFLGGLHAGLDEHELSRHLASRREVGQVLEHGGGRFTELRAGLVIGRGGSSFRMMMRLIRRLPVMVLPRWTSTPTQPIAIEDVQRAIRMVLEDAERWTGTFDLGIEERMTYGTMIHRAAACVGLRRFTIPVPISSPRVSTLWIMLFSGEPKSLVVPLIASLKTPTVTGDNPLLERLRGHGMIDFDAAIRKALDDHGEREDPRAILRRRDRRVIQRLSLVRSIQRIRRAGNVEPAVLSTEYWSWLGRLLPGILRVGVERDALGRTDRVEVSFLGLCRLLRLQRDPNRCDTEIETLKILDGLLVRRGGFSRARFEFRAIPCRDLAVTALHDYPPSLPWFVYEWSQAIVHRIVMGLFARRIRKRAHTLNGGGAT